VESDVNLPPLARSPGLVGRDTASAARSLGCLERELRGGGGSDQGEPANDGCGIQLLRPLS
jgi:hypothetical protein